MAGRIKALPAGEQHITLGEKSEEEGQLGNFRIPTRGAVSLPEL